MPEGLGYGIGRGMQAAAEGLWKRRELEIANNQDRDKQADKLVEQMHSIRDNLVQIGPDTPQGKQLSGQLKTLIEQHNALYPPHETPALLARIQKVFGKTPAAPQADPRASMTLEGEMATAKPSTLLSNMNDFIAAGQQANPTATREQLMQEWWKEQQIKGGTLARAGAVKPTWKLYKLADGTTDYFDINDPESIPQGAVAYTAGSQGPKTGTLGAYIASKYPNGATPEQQIAAKKEWADTVPKTHVIVGSEADYVSKKYPNATPEDLIQAHRDWVAAAASTTTGTHEIIHDNADGTATVYEVTSTTSKSFPGAEKLSTQKPATTTSSKGGTPAPAELKKKAGELKPGDTIAGKKTAAQNAAEKAWAEATKTAAQADTAGKAKSSVQDKLLIESLVKAASGRYSQASYENIVGKTGIGNQLEQFYNNVVNGGVLPEDVRNQAVAAAHSLRDAAEQERQAVATPSANTPEKLSPEQQKLLDDLKGIK